MPTIGSYFPEQNSAPLTAEERAIVDAFHELYYRRGHTGGEATISLSWLGRLALKCPMDLWIYQELLSRHRPEFVVETGAFMGGSALFLATVLDQIGAGQVISIDIREDAARPPHPRIEYLVGSSVEPAIVNAVRTRVAGRRAMVVLDSDHSAGHVRAEIEAYKDLVHIGDYLIVEDTNVNGHPVLSEFGPGPAEAVEGFLAANAEFAVDRRCERFMMTLNPGGYLRRVRAAVGVAEA